VPSIGLIRIGTEGAVTSLVVGVVAGTVAVADEVAGIGSVVATQSVAEDRK